MKNPPEKTNPQPAPSLRSRPTTILLGFIALFAAIAVVTVFTFSSIKDTARPNIAVVRITKAGFEPATLSVAQGTKVIWTSNDSSLHQVASNPYPKDNGLASLKSEILNNGQTYEYIAGTIGSFGYHDDQHPTTNGLIVVVKP